MAASDQLTVRFDSELHRKILPMIQERYRRSREAMSEARADKWTQCEEQFLAYMPEKDTEALRRAARRKGSPQFTTIEIPYSYAILLTAHTYITSTFLARSPVLQVSGRHGESQQSEMAIEALLDYQVQTGGHLVPYYIWTLDALKYGVGIIGNYWDEEKITVRRRQKVAKTFLGVSIPGTETEQEMEETVRGYVGTRAYNVRPQDFFPDPAYPISQFQKGEYCGRFVQLAWLDIVDGEKDGKYFNVAELKQARTEGKGLRVSGSSQITLPNSSGLFGLGGDFDTGCVEAYEMYIRLIPRDWGLGKSTRSEKWVFTVAGERIIIGAQPLGYYHNAFPFSVLEQEIDGHSLFSRSMLEITKPMNDTLTWLLNTHFYNVRKTLNDQFVVDPSRVVMRDMTDPDPGRLIRLKPAAYGTDVRTAVTQLATSDVTRAHVTDAQMIAEMLQRITGVNDNLMGMLNSGRKTATEVRSSTTFGINRMKTVTEYMSAMGFGPWAQQLVQVTQQMFDDERKFKVVGDAAQWGEKFMNVTPEQIAGFYDFTPVDGTLPVDRFAQVNLWKTLMEQATTMPTVMETYDFTKIFAFVAQLAGIKNINQFKVQIVPDGKLAGQVQAGNSVPAAVEGPSEPNQLPGMGATL